MFHVIALLNPVFDRFKSLLSFSADKVTTGTYNFVSFILNVVFGGESSLCSGLGPSVAVINPCSKLVITQFAEQFKVKDTSQLINGISSVLQKLSKYYNVSIIMLNIIMLFAS